jgi:spore germination protein GerM
MSGKDDRRMKDLADRLVAMSPEPPPFPEEVTVTQPRGSRPSPILMFAGAAVIVLILAAIPILLVGNGGNVDPIATTTTSTVPSTVTSEETVTTGEATTTTLDEETTSTIAGPDLRGTIIFLTQTPENSFTGDPALVPFFTNVVADPGDTAEEIALRTLTNPSLTPPPGFDTQIPAGVEVVSVRSDDGVRVVDMNPEFIAGSGSGLLGDFTMLNQLIYTATDDELFPQVQFTVGGEPVTQFGTDGLDISGPLDRDAFIDQLNSVILTSALTGSGSGPLTFTGDANVFEATVSLELVDSDGNVVYEDFTTATCGTGCWGSFSFHVQDFDFESTPVTARVFWHSPEDGEPADVVSVPVAWGEDGGWDFLP